MAQRTDTTAERFEGFPREMYDFWDGLDEDNTKEFFHAHKDQWQRTVRGPMEALLRELTAEFGQAHVFRPNRDIRFATDKRPYKEHHGAVIDDGQGSGVRYIHVDGSGILVAAGYHEMAADQLARFRAAVADDDSGTALVGLLDTARSRGLEVGQVGLVRVPRPWTAEHPREELLRHKRMIASHSWKQPPWLHRRDVVTTVRASWRSAAPLCSWLAQHVGASTAPGRR